jgi:hypothetical protein
MTVNVHSAIAPTGSRGQQLHALTDGDSPTYCSSLIGVNGFNGNLFQLQGSASVVLRITHIDITSNATGAAVGTIAIQRWSTSSTGGGQSGINNTKNDPSDTGPLGGPTFFTTAPSPGIPVGTPRTYPVTISGTGNVSPTTSLDFGNGPKKALILRGVNDFFTVALSGGFGGAGNVVTLNVEWTESAN